MVISVSHVAILDFTEYLSLFLRKLQMQKIQIGFPNLEINLVIKNESGISIPVIYIYQHICPRRLHDHTQYSTCHLLTLSLDKLSRDRGNISLSADDKCTQIHVKSRILLVINNLSSYWHGKVCEEGNFDYSKFSIFIMLLCKHFVASFAIV